MVCYRHTTQIEGTAGLKQRANANRRTKICITCSAGGHWLEAERVASLLKDCDRYYVTYSTPRLEEQHHDECIYFVAHCSRRRPFLILANAWQSMRILLNERPDFVLSTGADVTVPTCVFGKLLGAKLIFVESGGNVYTPSLTGRLMYPIADLFLVQWDPLKKHFPRAIVGGPLL